MNYFAHGRDLTDRPYALAGTALPDWLSASDRKARLRPERLDTGEIAAGVRRHLADDARFHTAPAFRDLSAGLTRRIRAGDPASRASFFGHVLTEMLLDAALIEADPAGLDAYYAALDAVDAGRILRRAEAWTGKPVRRLARTIDRFRTYRYLYGYRDDAGLHARLAGVARRTGLKLPAGLEPLLPGARRLVAARVPALLEPCAS